MFLYLAHQTDDLLLCPTPAESVCGVGRGNTDRFQIEQCDVWPLKRPGSQIRHLVEQLKNEQPDLYQQLRERIDQSDPFDRPLEIQQLYEYFDMEKALYHRALSDHWFSDHVIQRMVKYKDVDFLREIALLLYRRRDYENAHRMILRALELRRTGPAIVKLKERIEKAMDYLES